MSEFDNFAKEYDEALDRGISLSGESKDFFASGRINWVVHKLERLMKPGPRHILDFGCGTGTSSPLLKNLSGVEHVVGVDPSADSIRIASELNAAGGIEFRLPSEVEDTESFDMVFCNGVFHHIPPGQEREKALSWIYRRLKKGGLFFFWENNPLNIGTQIVMSRIPFDRDAVKILPWDARAMLRNADYRILNTSYMFIFPSFLKGLRKLEPSLSIVPLGAQYLVVAGK